MATDIFKSNGTDLASVFSLSEVMAEIIDGGELPEVTVGPHGRADVETCTYWTRTIGGTLNLTLTDPGWVFGIFWEEHGGTMTLCDNFDQRYCDYIGCH